MFILDTDCLSLLEHPKSTAGQRLVARLESQPVAEVVTTIVSFEEQTRGWLAVMAKAKTLKAQVEAYRRLNRHLDNFREWTVLDFDEAAAIEYQRLRALRLRVGTMDLKIAAITLSRAGILISRNISDFARIPDLAIEDWTS